MQARRVWLEHASPGWFRANPQYGDGAGAGAGAGAGVGAGAGEGVIAVPGTRVPTIEG